jgi:hypothetical protein
LRQIGPRVLADPFRHPGDAGGTGSDAAGCPKLALWRALYGEPANKRPAINELHVRLGPPEVVSASPLPCSVGGAAKRRRRLFSNMKTLSTPRRVQT